MEFEDIFYCSIVTPVQIELSKLIPAFYWAGLLRPQSVFEVEFKACEARI